MDKMLKDDSQRMGTASEELKDNTPLRQSTVKPLSNQRPYQGRLEEIKENDSEASTAHITNQ